jgi:hypothetical protein
VAGILGATAVAVWFLIMDIIYSHAFATPTALGRGLLRLFGPVNATDSVFTLVAAYTIFHYLAFIGAGLLVSVIVHWAQTNPWVLAGAMMLFAMFEIGFYGLSHIFHETAMFGALGWAQVAVGNLIAAIVMGIYFWRTHPELAGEFDYALAGKE